MKLKSILSLLFSTVICICVFSQNYTIAWQKTIGGDSADKLSRMIQTFDGGTMLCGFSNSPISGDKTQKAFNNSFDFWIVKLDSTGAIQWSKTFGGKDRDLAPTIIQTQDSGYLLAGSSISSISGDKKEDPVNNSFDFWALKLDKTGKKVWDNTVGGIQFEKLVSVLESPTGYFLCGSSNSTGGGDKTSENEGSSLWPDYWIVKLNKSGAVLWDSTYGSKNRDALAAAISTTDGGILLGGSSYSPRFGNKYDDYVGNNDFWILKLDSVGRPMWNRTIGGDLSDYLTSMDVVGNIGYVLAGYSNSNVSFNKTDSCRGVTDYWIIRIDKSGNILWDKTYGGSGADYATSVKFLSSTYYVGGYSNSKVSGDKTTKSYGGMDFWTITLDRYGNLLEQNDWGGNADDYLVGYLPIGNDFLLAGSSTSPKGNSKTKNTKGNTGKSDYWIFRIAPAGTAVTKKSSQPVVEDSRAADLKSQLIFSINPNPVKDILHINYSGNEAQKLSVSIYSNAGKLVNQQILLNPQGSFSLDMAAQSAGVYYAVLQSGSSSITKKFVKN